ncbi:MAG TPA: tetratricopeptide repeat protein [Ktedonobacterales bacterium]|jgi:tetratricopeptide (TPR) repeat protein
MNKFIAALMQPLSIASMSLAWLFCLGYLLTAIIPVLAYAPFSGVGWLPALFFGLQAGSVLILEFDHWRSYYGVGAFWRELAALLGIALIAWLLAQLWPMLLAKQSFFSVACALGLLVVVLLAPYLASQGSYLLLGEPLHFQRYLRLYYQRQWREIVRAYEPLVKRRPGALRPQLILAAAYFNLRQFDRARRLYQRLLERDHYAPGAWQGLAELDFTRGAWEEAAGHYDQALAYASYQRRGFIHIGLGIACYKLGRTDEATAHLKKSLSYPLSGAWRPIAAYALMRAARDTGDTRTAERALQSLALRRRAHKQFMDYWQAILNSSSSPLNSDYRAAVNLIDQLSWS